MKLKTKLFPISRTLALLLVAILTSILACTSSVKEPLEQPKEKFLDNSIALNAYSFNALLKKDSMDIFDVLEYCDKLGIDGVDITGYYFPGYPAPPPDEYIYRVKKRAFELGLDICGTGVKNDFCNPDPDVRKQDVELIKNWILVAEKLGAPALRVFQGKAIPENHSWDDMAAWATEVLVECADFGKEHGVMLEIQNHNNFLLNAEDVIKLLAMVNHEWVGLMLDVGSYRTSDPYHDISATIKYAVNWQLKEDVFIEGVRTPIDLEKIKTIILASDYKGYLPIETLGQGDPHEKIEKYYSEVLIALKGSGECN